MRPDGCLEHRGRKDFRVKIRGFGVELEEIETLLNKHPAVREVVTQAAEDESNDTRLVAYIVANEDQTPRVSELRKFLRERLPEQMVPSAFVFLPAFPLTPVGKVDRRALPMPNHAAEELEPTSVPPRTPFEEELARIWAEVLGPKSVGIHDNFFDLGGHSLLATQVISRVRGAFQVDLPLLALFENPTVAGLAAQITRIRSSVATPEETDAALANLQSLSDEEASRLLAQENSQKI
jgi:acyl carrier protein